ncbi:citrate/2-methylcitrate synthase [Pseudomonas aeruginosa]|nr:citrate/2-methylcitrate synthase [Pseudomonas aeruginosa]
MSTASCESKITYIDGDKASSSIAATPIEQLAEKSDYLETCYLLLNGELPHRRTREEQFVGTIKNHTMVHEQLKTLLQRLPPRRPSDGRDVRRDRRPLGLLPRLLDINNPKHREESPRIA